MGVWVKEMLRNLDESVDLSIRIKIMEACGEKCPYTHLTDDRLYVIKESSKDECDFLKKICDEWRLKKEGENYYVIFDKCYCPLVNDDLHGASSTLCYCTLGNIKRKFAIGLDRKIDVIMESNILSGGKECRFLIKI
ncbi:DUF6144 family protein [Desulfonatronum sp. SC1]|uniref:DUF6144 family protein n=1 Tax=Desulfonatronum sp. SC1 TaxID=2109626 RepID=UPI0011B2760C|nr:DUF6144 family protein [Desulfonatronum sp. SC1]